MLSGISPLCKYSGRFHSLASACRTRPELSPPLLQPRRQTLHWQVRCHLMYCYWYFHLLFYLQNTDKDCRNFVGDSFDVSFLWRNVSKSHKAHFQRYPSQVLMFSLFKNVEATFHFVVLVSWPPLTCEKLICTGVACDRDPHTQETAVWIAHVWKENASVVSGLGFALGERASPEKASFPMCPVFEVSAAKRLGDEWIVLATHSRTRGRCRRSLFVCSDK